MTITRRTFVTTLGAAPFLTSVGAILYPRALGAQEQPRRGGTLVYALGSDPAHLNFAITTDLNAQQAATHMFSQLFRVTKDGKFTGDLAESWDMAADGMTYTFKIRQNVEVARRQAAHRRGRALGAGRDQHEIQSDRIDRLRGRRQDRSAR